MGDNSCSDCFRGFFRIILVIVNIFVSLLGLLVLIVGIWAKVQGDDSIELVSNSGHSDVASVPVLLIVVGLFILLLGIAGTIGAIFAGTVVGRFIIGLYAFVLALLVICEIAGGIAAAVKKNDFNDSIQDSLNDSFSRYNSSNNARDAWNAAQKGLECCGYTNYNDYQNRLNFPNDSLPSSCCGGSSGACHPSKAYTQGCYTEVRNIITHNLSVVAGVGISFGFLQIIGVIISCFVAIAGARANSGPYQNV